MRYAPVRAILTNKAPSVASVSRFWRSYSTSPTRPTASNVTATKSPATRTLRRCQNRSRGNCVTDVAVTAAMIATSCLLWRRPYVNGIRSPVFLDSLTQFQKLTRQMIQTGRYELPPPKHSGRSLAPSQAAAALRGVTVRELLLLCLRDLAEGAYTTASQTSKKASRHLKH